ncbi:phage head closure protein [Mangrovicella endophytica]|uniref:phage head closure protein n=1 Tax=Mangrovicella endophytica TaxID=2066697 RepID=UPI000C9E4EF6|nr:phage head closure protein [Mangrovicella endophytica]
MGRLFLDPGLLRWQASLQTADLLPDASGGAVISWREVALISVHLEPVSAKAQERFGQREATVTHRVICRHRSGLDRGMAFVINGRRLIIRTVHDPDEGGRFLLCRCEEEG